MQAPKSVVLLRPRAAARAPQLGREVARRASAWLGEQAGAVRDVVVHVTEVTPPRVSLVPFGSKPFAMVSARAEPEAIEALRAALAPLGPLEGYLVEESVPRARPRAEPLGAPAPGPSLVTLFRRHPRLDRESFLREWHGHHTPLALEVHPLAGYVRNVVEDVLDAAAPEWDGIVVESFASPEDLLSPSRFFGGRSASPLHAARNALRVGTHASRFLDLRTIENHLVTERVLG